MTLNADFWNVLCSYEPYIEDIIGINAENLDPLLRFIQSPVLVIGAGQGLLVEGLHQRGFQAAGIDFSRQMIEYAEKRRSIKLIQASANEMPFRENQFKTTIVATGVIDFLEDFEQIGSIINETKRVTEDRGNIFVAFLGATPEAEELWRYMGIISDNDRLHLRVLYKCAVESKYVFSAMRKDPNKSIAGLVIRFFKSFMSMPGKTLVQLKRSSKVLRMIKRGELGDPGILLESLPDESPYRYKKHILKLFEKLDTPLKNLFVFDNCKIVHI